MNAILDTLRAFAFEAPTSPGPDVEDARISAVAALLLAGTCLVMIFFRKILSLNKVVQKVGHLRICSGKHQESRS